MSHGRHDRLKKLNAQRYKPFDRSSKNISDRGWIRVVFLIIAILISYQRLCHAGFIWDDDKYVTENSTVHSFDGLLHIWFNPGATVQYYPLTFTMFWIEYHLWGLHPFGYHLLNVLLHSVNAILLWTILRKLEVRGAWLAAGIFALHPVCVESVAWVTEGKNVLSGVFYFTSILTAMRFWLPDCDQTNASGLKAQPNADFFRGDFKFYWLAFTFYLCAVCSKTATLPLPAVVLLLVWWKRGGLKWRDILLTTPFVAIGMGMGIITIYVERHLGTAAGQWNLSFLGRCMVAGKDFWFYLGKLVWPNPLIFVYPRWKIDLSQASACLPVAAIIIVFCVSWFRRNSWGRPVLVALVYFLALLFLVLGFFNVFYFQYSYVSDHFQYLACVGPIALFAAGFTEITNRFVKRHVLLKAIPTIILLSILAVLTWHQCGMYKDIETLWKTTIAQNPNAFMAHDNLGSLLARKGRIDEAISHFQTALQIEPDDVTALDNLGSALLQKADPDDAMVHFQKATEIEPKDAVAYSGLGGVLLMKGDIDGAIQKLEEALRLNPNLGVAQKNLDLAIKIKERRTE
jgi:hypothetical protein